MPLVLFIRTTHAKRPAVTASQRQAPARTLGARAVIAKPVKTGLAASDFVPHRLAGDWTFRSFGSRTLVGGF